jgi:AraC-like DNA-binding protein
MCAKYVSLKESLPLSHHRLVASTCIDEATEILSQNIMPLRIGRVEEPQRFRLDMNGVRLGRLFLGYNQFATDTVVEPGLVQDVVALALGYDDRRPTFIELDDEQVRVSPRMAAAVSPMRQIRNFRPSNSGMFVLSMPASVLHEQLYKVTGESVRGPIVFDPCVDMTQGAGRLLRELTQVIATELERDGTGSENRLLWPMLEDALISVILALPGSLSRAVEDRSQPSDIAPRVVRRAEEYMAAHVGGPITLSDLVVACACSRSALYDAFKSSRGYTPMQFLMSRRLELARERLMGEHACTATSIAYECGFSHYGRFVKAYRNRFGESPSGTRARCHGPMRR